MDKKGLVHKVSLKHFPEAFLGLVVQKDDKMIGWLGRATFVSTCISGPKGWQEGVCIFIFLIPTTFSIKCDEFHQHLWFIDDVVGLASICQLKLIMICNYSTCIHGY